MELPFVIEPNAFTTFSSPEDQIEKCQEWGLLSAKATKSKMFSYKKAGEVFPCEIVGYADAVTAVIAFENGQRHCIHPSYLKEMQAAAFGRQTTDTSASATAAASADSDELEEKLSSDEQEKSADQAGTTEAGAEAARELESSAQAAVSPAAAEAAGTPEAEKTAGKAADKETDKETGTEKASKPKSAAKSGKKQKLELPSEKVRMTATVKEFTSVPNHFTEEEDEVVIYEAVAIADPALEVGDAWSSHSATLKKLELEIGDKLEFDAKIAAKKLTKHPVPYKINNPSKIQKRD